LNTKADQLQWRREKVVELRSRGMTHEEIARELQVSRASITSDIAYLREQAKESIKEYATDHLPEQYAVCLTALDEIIKRAFDMIERSDDERVKLQAMSLFKDTHLVKLELLSNATTIDSALSYIRSRQEQQEQSRRNDFGEQAQEEQSTSSKQTVF
jgi:transcriptional regulator